MKNNYIKYYDITIKKVNIPQNIITRIFLSKFSPIKRNFNNKKILDFSCGSGPYLNFLKSLGFKVYASEISKIIISKLKKKFNKIKFIVSNNKKINLSNNELDFFLAVHSLYYLNKKDENLDLIIDEILRVLKKDGYLICTFLKKNQKYLKFKKKGKHLYKIIYDKYKIRKNSYFHLFNNKKQIVKYFSKKFKVIEIGEYQSKLKNFEENYFIFILKKK